MEVSWCFSGETTVQVVTGNAGDENRLNLSSFLGTVHECSKQSVHSFVCCKRFDLISRRHKKAQIINSGSFIYG